MRVAFFTHRLTAVSADPLALPSVFRYFAPAVAKVYIVSFRSNDDRRPSKFIVVADNMKSAINMAWEHGGPDFQAWFDKNNGTGTGNDRGDPARSVMDNSQRTSAKINDLGSQLTSRKHDPSDTRNS